MKEYAILLLLSHVLGDFYVQTSYMAKKKKNSLKWVFFHGLAYWAVTLVVSIPVFSMWTFLFGSLCSALHLLIDILKTDFY